MLLKLDYRINQLSIDIIKEPLVWFLYFQHLNLKDIDTIENLFIYLFIEKKRFIESYLSWW